MCAIDWDFLLKGVFFDAIMKTQHWFANHSRCIEKLTGMAHSTSKRCLRDSRKSTRRYLTHFLNHTHVNQRIKASSLRNFQRMLCGCKPILSLHDITKTFFLQCEILIYCVDRSWWYYRLDTVGRSTVILYDVEYLSKRIIEIGWTERIFLDRSPTQNFALQTPSKIWTVVVKTRTINRKLGSATPSRNPSPNA